MKFLRVLALSALLPMAAAHPAYAADPEIDVDVQSLIDLACNDDVKKFCPQAEKGKTKGCLKRNEKELSSECKMARMTLDFLRKAAK